MIFGGVEHLPCTPQANRVRPNMAQENGWCQAVAPEVRPSALGHLCRVCCLELTCPRESKCVRKPTFQAGTQGARPIPPAVFSILETTGSFGTSHRNRQRFATLGLWVPLSFIFRHSLALC